MCDAAVVVNKRDHTLKPGDVYIGRGSRWGNPYSHREGTAAQHVVASREEAIESYRRYLWHHITSGELKLSDLAALNGKTLVCYCKPMGCHGDVLVSAALWAFAEIENNGGFTAGQGGAA